MPSPPTTRQNSSYKPPRSSSPPSPRSQTFSAAQTLNKRLSTTSTLSTSSSSSSNNDQPSLPTISLRAVSPRRKSALPAAVDLTHARRHATNARCGSAADWEECYRRCSEGGAVGGYVSFPDFDSAKAEAERVVGFASPSWSSGLNTGLGASTKDQEERRNSGGGKKAI